MKINLDLELELHHILYMLGIVHLQKDSDSNQFSLGSAFSLNYFLLFPPHSIRHLYRQSCENSGSHES